MRARVITVSDRSAAGHRADASGPVLLAALAEAGYEVDAEVVPDGAESVADALRRGLAAGVRLLVTTGGTGVSPRDRTPEGTRGVLDRELPGVAEALRAAGASVTAHAWLSRGIAGVVDASPAHPGAFVVNLPGSPGAARDGAAVVVPLAAHVLDQLTSGDHR